MKLLRTLFLVSIGVVVGCAISEVVCRVSELAPEIAMLEVSNIDGEFESSLNPELMYIPRASARMNNSYGIKSPEISLVKPIDTFRIVLLGDSIGYGYCPLQPLTIPELITSHMQEFLSQHTNIGKRIEVVNLSVSGYETRQEVAFFEEKGMPLDPDLVVLLYCLNDDVAASNELFLFDRLSGWKEFQELQNMSYASLLHSSAFFRFFIATFPRLKQLLQAQSDPHWLPDDSITGRTVREGFQKLSNLTSIHSIPVLIVVMPLLGDFTRYTEGWEHERTAKFAKESHFDFLDLLPPLRDTYQEHFETIQCAAGDIFHPNAYGASVIGKLIGERLATVIDAQTPKISRREGK